MHFKIKKILNYLTISSFIILISCQLQEPSNDHGILFLKNRADKLVISQSNINDVIKLIGQPHSKSVNNKNEWIYIERVLTKGEYHKLGQNVLKSNNVLILKFDKYGVLKNINFLNKENKNKIQFSKKETVNEITQKSFVEKFLSSIKTKMYGNK